MLHYFSPQEVFLVVFGGVVIVAYMVNRMHGVDVVRNHRELH